MNPGVFVISAGDGKFFSLMWKSWDWFIWFAHVLQYDEHWNRNWSFQRKKNKNSPNIFKSIALLFDHLKCTIIFLLSFVFFAPTARWPGVFDLKPYWKAAAWKMCLSRARQQAVWLPSSPPSPERLSLMITLNGAVAITYDLMTPAAIGRHSGGSRDCSCCPFSAWPPAGLNTASCSRLVCVPAKCQRVGTGLSSVSLLSALSGWPPPTRLCDLLITPCYVSQRQHGV